MRLKQQYKDKVTLFWIRYKPSQHYAIADSCHTLFEDPMHPEDGPRTVVIRYDYPQLAEDWERRFKDYVKKLGKKITI